jgi:hypothetical protein
MQFHPFHYSVGRLSAVPSGNITFIRQAVCQEVRDLEKILADVISTVERLGLLKLGFKVFTNSE